MLQAHGLKVGVGTIVDATLIGAPSSTKNADKQRDPEMHQTRKGQQWYFGMKLHIGVDSRTGLAHSAVVTAANGHDKHPLPDLLHGQDRRVYGESAYASQRVLIKSMAPRAKAFTSQRVRYGGEIDAVERSKTTTSRRSGSESNTSLPWSSGSGLCKGALPRSCQERHALALRAGSGQPLLGARSADGMSAPAAHAKRVREARKAVAQHEMT